MSCSSVDLKAYHLGEASEQERRLVSDHLSVCQTCSDELERLRLTQAALLSIRDEEIPRRIAFVSDKVFEPRWWHRLWQSGPRLGFASAAMLSLAIFTHTFFGTAQVTPLLDTAQLEARIQSEMANRLEAAVRKAVAESEASQARKAAELVAAAEKRMDLERQADFVAVQENFEVLRKRLNVWLIASADRGGER